MNGAEGGEGDKKFSRRELIGGAAVVAAGTAGILLSKEELTRPKEEAKEKVQYERVSALVSLQAEIQQVLAKREDMRFDINTGAIGLLDRKGNRSFYRGPADANEIQQVYGRTENNRSALVFDYVHKNGDTDTLRFTYDFMSDEIVVDKSAAGGIDDNDPPRGKQRSPRGEQDI